MLCKNRWIKQQELQTIVSYGVLHWKWPKSLKAATFNFLSNDLVVQKHVASQKHFATICTILLPQHWILKLPIVASPEAQLPLHVMHGKCQETCSFPSNFYQIPFKILGRSKWSIWKANCSNSSTSQPFQVPNAEFKFIEFTGFPCNILWLN